ncbi:hypothetical protein EG68_09499 [Paragonimus skrjabini miyazakii]|uniref:CCHC-type domain-containing protein n=1 Tax=Paragonimus skrjabini miyazakii TaxID=59628 RepID=A0A8S9YHY1_9TREM|nr:hypothetical protein EG68_09499 [Paragonimus skrjabini miyazakii]
MVITHDLQPTPKFRPDWIYSTPQDIWKWFNDSPSFTRVEFVCGLLQLCSPMELRFFGSCLEELARLHFEDLRTLESLSNSVTVATNESCLATLISSSNLTSSGISSNTDATALKGNSKRLKLNQLPSFFHVLRNNTSVRSQLLCRLFLLKSTNSVSADAYFEALMSGENHAVLPTDSSVIVSDLSNAFYPKLERDDLSTTSSDESDDLPSRPSLFSQHEWTVLDEIILIYTLAAFHPAFTFDQKNRIFTRLNTLRQWVNRIRPGCKANRSRHSRHPSVSLAPGRSALPARRVSPCHQLIHCNSCISDAARCGGFSSVSLKPVSSCSGQVSSEVRCTRPSITNRCRLPRGIDESDRRANLNQYPDATLPGARARRMWQAQCDAGLTQPICRIRCHSWSHEGPGSAGELCVPTTLRSCCPHAFGCTGQLHINPPALADPSLNPLISRHCGWNRDPDRGHENPLTNGGDVDSPACSSSAASSSSSSNPDIPRSLKSSSACWSNISSESRHRVPCNTGLPTDISKLTPRGESPTGVNSSEDLSLTSSNTLTSSDGIALVKKLAVSSNHLDQTRQPSSLYENEATQTQSCSVAAPPPPNRTGPFVADLDFHFNVGKHAKAAVDYCHMVPKRHSSGSSPISTPPSEDSGSETAVASAVNSSDYWLRKTSTRLSGGSFVDSSPATSVSSCVRVCVPDVATSSITLSAQRSKANVTDCCVSATNGTALSQSDPLNSSASTCIIHESVFPPPLPADIHERSSSSSTGRHHCNQSSCLLPSSFCYGCLHNTSHAQDISSSTRDSTHALCTPAIVDPAVPAASLSEPRRLIIAQSCSSSSSSYSSDDEPRFTDLICAPRSLPSPSDCNPLCCAPRLDSGCIMPDNVRPYGVENSQPLPLPVTQNVSKPNANASAVSPDHTNSASSSLHLTTTATNSTALLVVSTPPVVAHFPPVTYAPMYHGPQSLLPPTHCWNPSQQPPLFPFPFGSATAYVSPYTPTTAWVANTSLPGCALRFPSVPVSLSSQVPNKTEETVNSELTVLLGATETDFHADSSRNAVQEMRSVSSEEIGDTCTTAGNRSQLDLTGEITHTGAGSTTTQSVSSNILSSIPPIFVCYQAAPTGRFDVYHRPTVDSSQVQFISFPPTGATLPVVSTDVSVVYPTTYPADLISKAETTKPGAANEVSDALTTDSNVSMSITVPQPLISGSSQTGDPSSQPFNDGVGTKQSSDDVQRLVVSDAPTSKQASSPAVEELAADRRIGGSTRSALLSSLTTAISRSTALSEPNSNSAAPGQVRAPSGRYQALNFHQPPPTMLFNTRGFLPTYLTNPLCYASPPPQSGSIGASFIPTPLPPSYPLMGPLPLPPPTRQPALLPMNFHHPSSAFGLSSVPRNGNSCDSTVSEVTASGGVLTSTVNMTVSTNLHWTASPPTGKPQYSSNTTLQPVIPTSSSSFLLTSSSPALPLSMAPPFCSNFMPYMPPFGHFPRPFNQFYSTPVVHQPPVTLATFPDHVRSSLSVTSQRVISCHNCGQRGHKVKTCPSRLLLQSTSEDLFHLTFGPPS